MISVNLVWQFILAQMIGFVILLFILNLILYKPVLEVIRKRHDFVANLLSESQNIQQETKAKIEQYNQERLKAEEEGKSVYNSMLDQAKKLKEEKIAQINSLFKKEQSEFSSALKKDIESHLADMEAITNQTSDLLLKNLLKGEG